MSTTDEAATRSCGGDEEDGVRVDGPMHRPVTAGRLRRIKDAADAREKQRLRDVTERFAAEAMKDRAAWQRAIEETIGDRKTQADVGLGVDGGCEVDLVLLKKLLAPEFAAFDADAKYALTREHQHDGPMYINLRCTI